jgi:hypothetical protein
MESAFQMHGFELLTGAPTLPSCGRRCGFGEAMLLGASVGPAMRQYPVVMSLDAATTRFAELLQARVLAPSARQLDLRPPAIKGVLFVMAGWHVHAGRDFLSNF